jgi:hypothetical protein
MTGVSSIVLDESGDVEDEESAGAVADVSPGTGGNESTVLSGAAGASPGDDSVWSSCSSTLFVEAASAASVDADVSSAVDARAASPLARGLSVLSAASAPVAVVAVCAADNELCACWIDRTVFDGCVLFRGWSLVVVADLSPDVPPKR